MPIIRSVPISRVLSEDVENRIGFEEILKEFKNFHEEIEKEKLQLNNSNIPNDQIENKNKVNSQ